MKYPIVSLLALTLVTPAFSKTDFLDMGKNVLQSVAVQKSNTSVAAGLSDQKIGSGLKEALRIGTQKAVAQVGKKGGFLNDSHVRIPLPKPLAKLKSGLELVGASSLMDDVEVRMNKAAEAAAPKAASIFGKAVSSMSIEDARGILSGGQDSATQYFKRSTSPELIEAMLPIVKKNLADVGAIQSYNALTQRVKDLPMANELNLNVENYVTRKTLDGIFYYLAKEEASIRANPAARTTDLLRSVFR